MPEVTQLQRRHSIHILDHWTPSWSHTTETTRSRGQPSPSNPSRPWEGVTPYPVGVWANARASNASSSSQAPPQPKSHTSPRSLGAASGRDHRAALGDRKHSQQNRFPREEARLPSFRSAHHTWGSADTQQNTPPPRPAGQTVLVLGSGRAPQGPSRGSQKGRHPDQWDSESAQGNPTTTTR